MFKIQDLMSGNFSAYPKETQEFMKRYTDKLKENIKVELIEDMADRMLKDINNSNEVFVNILTEILENGCKGFNEMSTQKLMHIYLERKDEKSFMRLIEKVNKEVE